MKIRMIMRALLLIFSVLFVGCGDSAKVNRHFDKAVDRRLVQAAAKGDEAGVDEALRAGSSVDCRGVDQITPLVFAVLTANKKATLLLLKKGANPNLQWNSRQSPISLSAEIQDAWYLETMLKYGGDANLRDELERTPIFDAVSGFSITNIDILLKAGADVNAQDHSGYTPMIYAANLNQVDIVYHFLQLGADPTIEDRWHYTMLYPLQRNSFDPASPAIIDRDKVINWLKERNLWRIEEDRKQ